MHFIIWVFESKRQKQKQNDVILKSAQGTGWHGNQQKNNIKLICSELLAVTVIDVKKHMSCQLLHASSHPKSTQFPSPDKRDVLSQEALTVLSYRNMK